MVRNTGNPSHIILPRFDLLRKVSFYQLTVIVTQLNQGSDMLVEMSLSNESINIESKKQNSAWERACKNCPIGDSNFQLSLF